VCDQAFLALAQAFLALAQAFLALAQDFAMVVMYADPLRPLDGVSTRARSRIPNGAGKIVLILDPASKYDLDIFSDQYRKTLELSGLARQVSAGPVRIDPLDKPDPLPFDAALSLPATRGSLSGRQRDVLKLIVQGLSNKEIAHTIKIAEGTVKIHIAALFGKLGVHRRAAVAVAGARFLLASELESAGLQPAASPVEPKLPGVSAPGCETGHDRPMMARSAS
jgi:DNA-binding CsgD family transcriptional regulator